MATKLRMVKKRVPGDKPLKISEWICVVNTNIHVDDMSAAELAEWRHDIRDMWKDTYALLTVPPKGEDKGVGVNRLPRKADIERIDVELSFEIGPETHFPHYHIHVTVRHRTKVYLNLKLIHQVLNEMITIDGKEHKQFFGAKLVKGNPTVKIESYFDKPDAEVEALEQV